MEDLQTEFVNLLLLYFNNYHLNLNLKLFKVTKPNRSGDYSSFVSNVDKEYLITTHSFRSIKDGDCDINSDTNCSPFIMETGLGFLSKHLANESLMWRMPVSKVEMKNGKLLISLNRPVSIRSCISRILDTNSRYGQSSSHAGKVVAVTTDVGDDPKTMSDLRIYLAADILKRTLAFEGADIKVEPDADHVIHLWSKPPFAERRNSAQTASFLRIMKVDADQSPSNYAMSLKENLSLKVELVDAVIRFDLLKTKVSQLVKFGHTTERARVTVYVVYNYVRLKAILDQFAQKVASSVYPPLPPLETVDFTQLTCEEEWHIVFRYLLEWPVVVRTICDATYTEFNPHNAFIFLIKLSNEISSYYGKERILMDSRRQLLPTIYARIYLVKAVTTVMENAFSILGIKPLSHM